MKQVILTGLRANNDMTIGNYFGALMPLIDMAKSRSDDFEVNLMMADLHSFSTPIDHSRLHQQIEENIRAYIAAGLPMNHDGVRLFRESHVPAHSELAHILDCFTGVGEMERMTQYKDKSAKIGNNRVSMALLNYPPLMAADVLLYGANYVPVGDDQTQHLEYVRDIAQRMNTKFGELFVVPEQVKAQHEFFGKSAGQRTGLRIMDLTNPAKKMSKSDDTGKGVIFLSDKPEQAVKKIMSAATDSLGKIKYDPTAQPGISNLLDILALLRGQEVKQVAAKYEGQTSYNELKEDVAKAMSDFLADFQAKLAKVEDAEVAAKLERDETVMNKQANATLLKVQQAVGLRPTK